MIRDDFSRLPPNFSLSRGPTMNESRPHQSSNDPARSEEYGQQPVPSYADADVQPGTAFRAPTTSETLVGGSADGAAAPAINGLEALNSRLAMLEERSAEIAEQNRRILTVLEDRAAFDRARESAIDKMHGELQVFKQKGIDYARKEVLLSLLLLYDNVQECLARIEADSDSHASVDFLREILLETLFREDVEPMEFDDDRVRRQRHKIIRTVPTEDPALDHTVEQVTRRGFVWRDTVLRPEHVVVRRYRGEQRVAAGPSAAD